MPPQDEVTSQSAIGGRRASGQEADRDKEQSAPPENPVSRLESAASPHWQPPALAPGLVVRKPVNKPAQVVQPRRRWRSRDEMVGRGT
jgi:hypothetical protein